MEPFLSQVLNALKREDAMAHIPQVVRGHTLSFESAAVGEAFM